MKATVKTYEELKDIVVFDDSLGDTLALPSIWLGYTGMNYYFLPEMKKYCGKEIELRNWDGWRGFNGSLAWTLPMLNIMNRNGANEN